MKNVQMCKLHNDGFYREIVISSVEHTHGRSVVLRKSFSSSHARIFIYFFTVDLMPFCDVYEVHGAQWRILSIDEIFYLSEINFFPSSGHATLSEEIKRI